MVKRRKFVVGLGALAAGGAAALGTGAGNVATVKDRHATVDVTRDYNAWLALRAVDQNFADDSGDKLVLDLGESNAPFVNGQGPNTDAVWKIPNVFGVSNGYNEDLKIWATIDNFPNGSPVFLYYTDTVGVDPDPPFPNKSGPGNKKMLPSGWTQNFGIYIDTENVNLGDKNLEFTIHADQVSNQV